MAHRKWKESKQQPSMLPGPAEPGSCLASFHFLWAIVHIRPVQLLSDNITVSVCPLMYSARAQDGPQEMEKN